MKPELTVPKSIPQEQAVALLALLKQRFGAHMPRHEKVTWETVQARLLSQQEKLWSLNEMETTGGEPDVTGMDLQSGEIIYTDCAAESPAGRRSLCYDPAALESRKEHKPRHSVLGMAAEMGCDVLTAEQYRALQLLGPFDRKTSSWVLTPESVRDLGGALFGDSRYGEVFIYHNGAESYYGSRGFRTRLRV